MALNELNLFAEEIHQPFLWPAGRHAAILVHGFPGTPAEVRSLAKSLYAQGWTVQAPLLPGFGPQINRLFEQTKDNWINEVRRAQEALRQNHESVLLIGYSMGGAVALNVAAQNAPDGLVLLAPFWRIGTPVHKIIWQGIKRVFPEFQPFKRLDFNNPQIRHAMGDMLSNVDLTDPQVQTALRELRVPSRLVDEVLALGLDGKKAAAHVTTRTLVIQGSDDPAISPKATHQLIREIAGPLRYKEVTADHKLLDRETAVYPEIEQAILDFARQITR